MVEFVGLPGAGKSTVAPLLAESLASHGWSSGNRQMLSELESHRLVRYGRLVQFYLWHPSELGAALRLGSAAHSPTPLRLAQGVKYVSVWSHRLARARRQGQEILILDQGIVQSAWSLLLRGNWRHEMVQAAVSRIILAAGLQYVLVYFDVAVGVAVQRIGQRPTMESRFDHLDSAETARQLALRAEWLEDLFTQVVDVTGAAHYRVDASQSPHEVCSEIETFLEAVARGPADRAARIP